MIRFENVHNVFGPSPKEALRRLDQGETRDDILEQTGNLVATAGVTHCVQPGEILVLMGLSGSGKSTLLRCANALVTPARGQVFYDGDSGSIDLGTADRRTLHRIRQRKVSMVFQKFALLPWRTHQGNVGFGLEIRGEDPAEIRRVTEEKLHLVGLGPWKDKYPHELSGGMQQRVGLARALATDPDLLLLDEPFSALDPLIRTRMQDELLILQKDLRKTMIFVSHDLDEALKLGSRVAILEAGRLIQVGTPEEIVTAPSTEYVRRFVSHVNPLNVLRAGIQMRPLGEIRKDPALPSGFMLRPDGSLLMTLDPEGRIQEIKEGATRSKELSLEEFAQRPSLEMTSCIVRGLPDAPMRRVIEVLHRTGHPFVVVDQSGHVLGMVSETEILASLHSNHALQGPGQSASLRPDGDQ